MRLLADANIGRGIIQKLAELGHDVLRVAAVSAQLTDSEILEIAHEQQRIVLTADKDFGKLVFLQMMPCPGVILLRVSGASEQERTRRFARAWPIVEPMASGSFVVITNQAIRRTRLPC